MLGRLLFVAGIATTAALKFSNYNYGDQNYLKVELEDGTLQCPSGSKLAVQYNLASLLIPGVSPLAYRKEAGSNTTQVWNDPAGPSFALPEWWARNQEPGRAAYRLRNESDHLLATGLFIPELELNGEFWSATNSTSEAETTRKKRAGFSSPSDCTAGSRPSETDVHDPQNGAIADLEEVQKLLAGLENTGDNYEDYTDDVVILFDKCTFGAYIGNITGYK